MRLLTLKDDTNANNEDDESSDSDVEYEGAARKHHAQLARTALRLRIINTMYAQARHNDMKAKSMRKPDIAEYIRHEKEDNERRRADYIRLNTPIVSSLTSMMTAVERKPLVREKVKEKSSFDVSRNFEKRHEPFRIATSRYNSRIEVFTP